MTAQVTIYVRPGCHLCGIALDRLRALQPDHGFSLQVVDIESDDTLHARYLERIPVIALDGDDLYDFTLDEPDLMRRLRAVESA